jgi:hypothetical protein
VADEGPLTDSWSRAIGARIGCRWRDINCLQLVWQRRDVVTGICLLADW